MHNLVVQLPYIILLIPFTKSFEQILAHPGQILKVLVFGSNFPTQVLALFTSAHTVPIIWVKTALGKSFFPFEELLCIGICMSVHFSAELQDNYG